MAFQPTGLALLSQGRGFGLWHYRLPPADSVADATNENYFAGARHLLRVGDLVITSRSDGSAGGIAAVERNDHGVIDLADSMPVLAGALGGATDLRCHVGRLAILAYANGFTLWHYHCADELQETEQAGYWDDAGGLLQPGDFIFGRYVVGGQACWAYSLVVGNDGASVVVAQANAFS